MESKNYTMTCLLVGEVTEQNLKKVADVTMHNCAVIDYKGEGVIATCTIHNGWGERPNCQFVTIKGEDHYFNLKHQRVSVGMGKEIIENILKAVEESKKS